MTSAITTHVLDTAHGRPAAGVPVRLERLLPEGPQPLASATTDHDGRVTDLGPNQVQPGRYRLVFDVADYHDGFFPEVVITFTVSADERYHVPLLVSPYGYSTYRGS